MRCARGAKNAAAQKTRPPGGGIAPRRRPGARRPGIRSRGNACTPHQRALGKELRTSVLAPELFVEREAAELGRSRRAAQLVMAASRRLAAGVVAFVLHVHVHVLFTVHASSTAENGAKPVVIDAHVAIATAGSTRGIVPRSQQ